MILLWHLKDSGRDGKSGLVVSTDVVGQFQAMHQPIRLVLRRGHQNFEDPTVSAFCVSPSEKSNHGGSKNGTGKRQACDTILVCTTSYQIICISFGDTFHSTV